MTRSSRLSRPARRAAVLWATVVLVLVAALSDSRPALAQRDVIDFIRVQGNQRIEDETVISYMKVVVGDRFDGERIDRSLKSLFATGLFADVSMRREGGTLLVTVVENPIINQFVFEGNKKITDEALAGEVQLRPRVVYTRTKVQKDVARVLELYRASGRFGASVEPKVIPLRQNRVDLVFEIKEGAPTGVQRIVFIGNEHFSDATLRETIQTRQSRWWRFLSSADAYDPDRLSFDRELLRRFYIKEGFADFRVTNAIAELTPDRENFYITFTIDEGPRYRYGEVKMDTTLPDLDTETLWGDVSSETGDWYNAEEVEETVQNLTDAVGSQGYAFVEIRPEVRRNREDLSVDVAFHIDEGPRVYVQRIDITGNVRTLDRIIRRNVRLAEGDAFNSAKMRRSRKLIEDLGFFSDIQVVEEPGDGPDQTIVTVDVAERSTGEVNFGAGFSTVEGPLASIGIRERNLLGRGQNLGLQFTISGIAQNINLQFTEPYFLNRDVAAGFDVFSTARDFDESSFERDLLGFTLRAAYPVTENVSQAVRYSLRREDITALAGASQSILDQSGKNLTSSVGQSLTFNYLDNKLTPTDGYFARWSVDVAGLGGDRHWLRNILEAGYYYPPWDDWVLSVIGEVSNITGLGGEDIQVSDRFFLGGNSFRGFRFAGVGPRDLVNNSSLGGNLLYKLTGEMQFPLGLPDELGIKGRVFAIAGTLTTIDLNDPNIADTGSLRLSLGVGISWDSPFGPIRVDFARPLVKEEFDETEFISFGVGSLF